MLCVRFEEQDFSEGFKGTVDICELDPDEGIYIVNESIPYQTSNEEEFLKFKNNWNLKDVAGGEADYIRKTIKEKFSANRLKKGSVWLFWGNTPG